jgi:hypothetical protein
MAVLIERSLGRREDWYSLSSRTGLNLEAPTSGVSNVSSPRTQVIGDVDSLGEWVAEEGLPVVLKTDGSWGGQGVAIVRDASALVPVWHRISNPPGLIRSLKRAVFDSDVRSLERAIRRLRPVVNAQQFVSGREAIATVACLNGEVVAVRCFEVVQATEAKGPAAVVRVIDHAGMAETARRLVRRFGLTGFCGLDFMIAEDGSAHLLELNLRATPTCHLLIEGNYACGQVIRLFPADLIRRKRPGTEAWGLLDVPLHAPSLIRAGERMSVHANRPVKRLIRRARRQFRPIPD